MIDNYLTYLWTTLNRLETPISPVFSKNLLTGEGDGGDHSGNLLSGKILKHKSDYSEIKLEKSQEDSLINAYNESREVLISGASTAVLAS